MVHSLPVKRVALIEMEEWKNKWLCYNCDKKFTPGHHCATQKIYVLDVETPKDPSNEAFEDAVEDMEEETTQPDEVLPKISYNALYGFNSPQMMKVKG